MALYGGPGLLLYEITTKLLIIILNMHKKVQVPFLVRRSYALLNFKQKQKMSHKMYQATKRLKLLRIYKINICCILFFFYPAGKDGLTLFSLQWYCRWCSVLC